MLCFSHPTLTYLVLLHYLAKYETQKTALHCCIVRTTQSSFCSALDFVYPEPCPKEPRAERYDCNIYGVMQQREYESRVKKIEEEIKHLVELRQCTNAAIEGKCNFRVSPLCQVVHKHKLFEMV